MPRPPQDGFKPRNVSVETGFHQVINTSFKNPRKVCNFCDKEMDSNTTRLQGHLDRCKPYLAGKLPKISVGGSQQSLPNMVAAMPETKHEHWRRADMAVYMTNLPFTHYENSYVRDYIYGLNSRYGLPDHRALSGHILNECYGTVQVKVALHIKAARWLNFYTDESNNIRRERVINLLVHVSPGCGTERGCFYITSEINGSKTMNAEAQLAFVFRQVIIVTDESLERMNSLATDTCSTMRSLWGRIQETPQLRHVFCVPCDSHGIQLFLKDIFQLPWWKNVIGKAQLVIRSFRAAHKEYAVLQKIQQLSENEAKRIALIIHCITRWGTQVGMLHSLRRNQQSLEAYSQQAFPQIDKAKKKDSTSHVLPIIRDPYFWKDVAIAARILTSIHEIQYLSEADNYPLYRVINNWMLIKQSLMQSTLEHGTKHCQIPHIVNTMWDERFLKQITPLHVITALLVPSNHAVKSMRQASEAAFGLIMTEFFRQYAPPEQLTNCMRDF